MENIYNIPPLPNLMYISDNLLFDSVALRYLGDTYQTPLYIYSQSHMSNSYNSLIQSFSCLKSPFMICYAVKSNSNLSILKLLADIGCGFDIVSSGELLRILSIGCDPHQVVFSGVSKSKHDIELAIKSEILCFNVESSSELERINEIAISMNKIAPISIRVNPDVDPKTHEYISTSLKINKFGVSLPIAYDLYKKAKNMLGVSIKGIDCHMGSQIFTIGPYIEALRKIMDLLDMLELEGIYIEHMDIGGGFGVSYFEEGESNKCLDIGLLAVEIEKLISAKKIKLIIEPGRYIVANAGIMLTKVEYIKRAEIKNFALIDAGMNDLIRPSLYKAYHKILEVERKNHVKEEIYDVVGPVCESGDFIGKERKLRIEEGDYLAVLSCGAYGMTMSSNYNTRARPAEIMIYGDKKVKLIRERENIYTLFEKEKQFL